MNIKDVTKEKLAEALGEKYSVDDDFPGFMVKDERGCLVGWVNTDEGVVEIGLDGDFSVDLMTADNEDMITENAYREIMQAFGDEFKEAGFVFDEYISDFSQATTVGSGFKEDVAVVLARKKVETLQDAIDAITWLTDRPTVIHLYDDDLVD